MKYAAQFVNISLLLKFTRYFFLQDLNNLFTNHIVHRCGLGGSMRSCHAADPGSIPGRDKFPR